MTWSGSPIGSIRSSVLARMFRPISARATVWTVGAIATPSTWPPCGSMVRGRKRRPGLTGRSPGSSARSCTIRASIRGRTRRDTVPDLNPSRTATSFRVTGPVSSTSLRQDRRLELSVSRWRCSPSGNFMVSRQSRHRAPLSASRETRALPVDCVNVRPSAASRTHRSVCSRRPGV